MGQPLRDADRGGGPSLTELPRIAGEAFYFLPGFSRSWLRLSFIVDPHREQTKTSSLDLSFGSGIGPFMRISRLFDWVQFGQRGIGRSWKRGEEGFSMVNQYNRLEVAASFRARDELLEPGVAAQRVEVRVDLKTSAEQADWQMNSRSHVGPPVALEKSIRGYRQSVCGGSVWESKKQGFAESLGIFGILSASAPALSASFVARQRLARVGFAAKSSHRAAETRP